MVLEEPKRLENIRSVDNPSGFLLHHEKDSTLSCDCDSESIAMCSGWSISGW